MLARREVAGVGAKLAHDQEDRAHQNVEAMESRRHVEGRAIIVLAKGKRGMGIFISLDAGEQQAQRNGQHQALLQPVTIAVDQRVMRSEEHTSELPSLMRKSYSVF